VSAEHAWLQIEGVAGLSDVLGPALGFVAHGDSAAIGVP